MIVNMNRINDSMGKFIAHTVLNENSDIYYSYGIAKQWKENNQ